MICPSSSFNGRPASFRSRRLASVPRLNDYSSSRYAVEMNDANAPESQKSSSVTRGRVLALVVLMVVIVMVSVIVLWVSAWRDGYVNGPFG